MLWKGLRWLEIVIWNNELAKLWQDISQKRNAIVLFVNITEQLIARNKPTYTSLMWTLLVAPYEIANILVIRTFWIWSHTTVFKLKIVEYIIYWSFSIISFFKMVAAGYTVLFQWLFSRLFRHRYMIIMWLPKEKPRRIEEELPLTDTIVGACMKS